MKITEYPELLSLSENDVVLVDGPTGTHTFKAKKLGSQAIIENWEDIWTKIYPVGALYISYDSVSPALLFGGTWTQISGSFLRAANDTNTGGADTITLSASQSGLKDHAHAIALRGSEGTSGASLENPISAGSTKWTNGYVNTSGGMNASSAFSNMPSYQDVYVWRRTS